MDELVTAPPSKETSARIALAILECEAGRLRSGSDTIGNRATPRRSIWPMKDKWKKFGAWFSTIGRDGDVRFMDGYGPVLPMVIQLFYHVLPTGEVEQLAWERYDLYEQWRTTSKEPTIDIIGELTKVKWNG